jgi:hypothetical protein
VLDRGDNDLVPDLTNFLAQCGRRHCDVAAPILESKAARGPTAMSTETIAAMGKRACSVSSRTPDLPLTCRNSKGAVKRAAAKEGGQENDEAEEPEPVPPLNRSTLLESKCDQSESRDNAYVLIDHSYVSRHGPPLLA